MIPLRGREIEQALVPERALSLSSFNILRTQRAVRSFIRFYGDRGTRVIHARVTDNAMTSCGCT